MILKYIESGKTLVLQEAGCIGCGMCVDVCPHAVFQLNGMKAVIAQRDLCMECGACAKNCPVGVLSVQAGVGCAAAIISGALKGTAPECGCSGGGKSCC